MLKFFSNLFKCPRPSYIQVGREESKKDEDDIEEIRKAVIVGDRASEISQVTRRILGHSLTEYRSTISRDCDVVEFEKKQIHIWTFKFEEYGFLIRIFLQEANLILVCISSHELMQDKLESVNNIMQNIRQYEEIRQVKFNFLFVATRCELVSHDQWGVLLEKLQQLAKEHHVDSQSCLFYSAKYDHNLRELRRKFFYACYPKLRLKYSWSSKPQSLQEACARTVVQSDIPYLLEDKIPEKVKETISLAQRNLCYCSSN